MTGRDRVWLVSAAAALGCAALYAASVARFATPAGRLPWPAMALLFGLAEIFVVHFTVRHDSHTISLAEVPLVLALVFGKPQLVVPAHVLGAACVLFLYRRQPPVKLVFNLCSFALQDVVALVVFHGLVRGGAIAVPSTWAAAFAATGAAWVVGAAGVRAAISLSEGSPSLGSTSSLAFGLGAAAMATSLGLTVALLSDVDRAALLLLVLPFAGVYLAQRYYSARLDERLGIEFLHRSTGLLAAGSDVGWGVDALLSGARATFRADVAALVYFSCARAEEATLTAIGPGDEHRALRSLPRPELQEAWSVVVPGPGGRVFRRGIDSDLLPGVTIRDGVAVPLLGERGTVGYLLVANRLTDVTSFSADDLLVLETVGRHVGVGLENGRLEQATEQLRVLDRQVAYRATHDPATGLVTRPLFAERVASRLRDADGPEQYAVVAVALGDSADRLVGVAAQRLRGCTRSDDLLGRVADDVLTVLAATPGGRADAVQLVKRIAATLAAPITLDGTIVTLAPVTSIVMGGDAPDAIAVVDRSVEAALSTR